MSRMAAVSTMLLTLVRLMALSYRMKKAMRFLRRAASDEWSVISLLSSSSTFSSLQSSIPSAFASPELALVDRPSIHKPKTHLGHTSRTVGASNEGDVSSSLLVSAVSSSLLGHVGRLGS